MDRSATVLRPGAPVSARASRRPEGGGPTSGTPTRRGALLSTLCLFLALAPASASASAQEGQRPDQVHVYNAKNDRRTVVTGVVVENGLGTVRVEREGKEQRLDALEVERIVWGTVSPAFREAQVFYERGDFENAAARFRQATDVEEREVVKAAARRRAGESLMQLGASDPSRYPEALEELERYLSEHPQDRLVPEARRMQARCKLLAGDAKAAAGMYKSLFEEGASATASPGYPRMLCLHAGHAAAEAMLAAGDSLGAREVLGALKSAVASMQSQVQPDSPQSDELATLAAEADLGEGRVLVLNDQASQAETFFQSRLRNTDSAGATTRFGATMGLAEALAAQGKLAEARVLFARVAAIDFTSRDRSARALLRLAQTTLELKEPQASTQARKWLMELVDGYGDTPSAGPARAMLESL